jgi:hypothetical protein
LLAESAADNDHRGLDQYLIDLVIEAEQILQPPIDRSGELVQRVEAGDAAAIAVWRVRRDARRARDLSDGLTALRDALDKSRADFRPACHGNAIPNPICHSAVLYSKYRQKQPPAPHPTTPARRVRRRR